MVRIILASQSAGRFELLKKAGIIFEAMPSSYEEDHFLSKDPYELVKILALGKARDISKKVSDDAIIIGADSMVLIDGKMIGKPKNRIDAYEQVKLLSGRTHLLLTGLAVIKGSEEYVDIGETKVTFRKLDNQEINDYLNSFDYTRCAGAYAIDLISSLIVEKINGEYSNVVGLPMTKLALILKKTGFNIYKNIQEK
ncbi:Septum formation protein Maf [Candidatus Tiddalikarchaeum anstoanum]|nr:Septum formation protein Maf [Candidatus Tiddalikarchaeum anstoanum]